MNKMRTHSRQWIDIKYPSYNIEMYLIQKKCIVKSSSRQTDMYIYKLNTYILALQLSRHCVTTIASTNGCQPISGRHWGPMTSRGLTRCVHPEAKVVVLRDLPFNMRLTTTFVMPLGYRDVVYFVCRTFVTFWKQCKLYCYICKEEHLPICFLKLHVQHVPFALVRDESSSFCWHEFYISLVYTFWCS